MKKVKAMQKVSFSKVIGFVTGLTILNSTIPVSAEDLNTTLQQQQSQENSLQNEIETITKEIVELENKITEKQNEIDEKKSKVEETKNKIKEINSEIEVLKNEIEETKNIIAGKENEIASLEASQEKRIEILKERAVTLQQQDRTSIVVDVILNSENIVDLLQRASTLSFLFQSDTDIMQELQATQVIVESEKQMVEEEKQTFTEQQEALQKKQEALQQEQEALQKQQGDLQEQQNNLQTSQSEKEASLTELTAKLDTVKSDIATTNAQIEEQLEAARKAKEEEEKEKQRAQEKQSSENSQNDESNQNDKSDQNNESNQNNTSVVNIPAITSGLFMRPANGPVTSEFGMRTLNGSDGNHAGIDIGKRGDNVPVVAVADGVVTRSYYSSSYGNVVLITHNLNGKVYTTLYAHMESRSVQSGATVKKGQQLGIMGNTGNSFGAHLHFEIHEGEWNAKKSNAVNPRAYINF